MTALHEAAHDRGQAARKPGRWPLLVQPVALISYVVVVVGFYLATATVVIARTPIRPEEVMTFAGLLVSGGLCIEATRRLGAPTGISRDLLSAWWLPVA